jgi:shikimate kinase
MTGRVVLIGMMGTGKSTLGRELAARTGQQYLDNDELLLELYGRSAAEILDVSGEVALREAESAVLHHALSLPGPSVVGVAAGAVLDGSNRSLIAQAGVVVRLRAQLSTLAERLGSDQDRPWLAPDPLAALQELYRGREQLYAELADLVVDIDGRDVDAIATEILAAR